MKKIPSTIWMTPEEKAQAKKKAEQYGLNMSRLIALAVRQLPRLKK